MPDQIEMSWRDYRSRRCWLNGNPLLLGPIETEIMSALLAKRGRPVTTADLIEAAWPDDEPDTSISTIRVHIYRLRRKMPGLIRLAGARKSGWGYIIDLPAEERMAA